MLIYDLSLPISAGMSVWPGDPTVEIEAALSLEAGDGANVSRLCLGTHTGTHVDAPAHLAPGGATVEALPWDTLIGPAWVIDWPGEGPITAAGLRAMGLPADARRLLFRTRNSERGLLQAHTFQADYVALSGEAAAWLLAQGVRLVGIDALSVDPYEEEAGPAHRALLAAEVVIAEGLDLRRVPAGRYTLYCLPLKLVRADGAPARVILVAGEG